MCLARSSRSIRTRTRRVRARSEPCARRGDGVEAQERGCSRRVRADRRSSPRRASRASRDASCSTRTWWGTATLYLRPRAWRCCSRARRARSHALFVRDAGAETAARSRPPGGRLLSTEPLADERFGVGTERAALQKLRSDHDVAFTIIDVAATARAPEACAAALRNDSDAKDPSSRRFVDRREKRRVKETTLDDDESLRNFDDERARRSRGERLGVRRDQGRCHSRVLVVASRARRRGRVAAQADARLWKFWKSAARVDRGGGFPHARRRTTCPCTRCARFPADASCWRPGSRARTTDSPWDRHPRWRSTPGCTTRCVRRTRRCARRRGRRARRRRY